MLKFYKWPKNLNVRVSLRIFYYWKFFETGLLKAKYCNLNFLVNFLTTSSEKEGCPVLILDV